MLDALYQSLVIFFVAEAAYSDSDIDMWEFGTTITTSCLITMLLHGAIEIKSWVRIYAIPSSSEQIIMSTPIFSFADNTPCFINYS